MKRILLSLLLASLAGCATFQPHRPFTADSGGQFPAAVRHSGLLFGGALAPQTPIYCYSAMLIECNTTTNPGNGSEGDPAYLAFGKLNSWGTQLGLFATNPINEVLGTGTTGIVGLETLSSADIATALSGATAINGTTIAASAGTAPGSTGTFTLSDCLEVGSTAPLEIKDAGAGCNTGSGGGLTSVGLSTTAGWLTVGSSPLTANGTITVNPTGGLTANEGLFTPNGTTGPVGLRAMVLADLPSGVGLLGTAQTYTALPTLQAGLALSTATAATSGANANSPIATVAGNFWNGTVSGADNWTIQDILGTGSNPTSTLTFSQSGSTGASAVSLPNIMDLGVLSASCLGTDSTGKIITGTCSGTGTVTDGSGTTTANELLLSSTTAHAYTNAATLPAAAMPALTGDVTSTAGSTATTVSKVNGAAVPASANCLGTNSSSQFTSGCAEPLGNSGAQVTALPYTVATTDCGKQIVVNDASAGALDVPQANGSFATCQFDVTNLGAGTVTVTPTTSTVNGTATLAVAQNRQCTLNSDGTNWQVIGCTALVTGGSGSPSDVQVFTASGTWTKPATGNTTKVACIGGGGGGGSGGVEPSGTAANGGPGGGGADLAVQTFKTSALSSTVSVTIATGGTGGAAVTATGNGNNGTAGGNSTFGSYLTAFGGGAGQPSTNYGGASGGLVSGATTHYGGSVCGANGAGGGTGSSASCANGGSGAGGSNGTGGAGENAGDAGYGGSGGGAGGGIPTGATFSAGGNSGSIPTVAGETGGATDGAAGVAGTCGTAIGGCTGGSGGASSVAGTGGTGGAGGIGAGGGGGGASETTSGAGGNGGNGECWVITW